MINKKLRNFFTLFMILILLIFYGCGGFVRNDKLIGRYGLVAVDDDQQTCLCYFDPNNQNGCIPVVTQTVFSVGYNRNYILVKQHPNINKHIIKYFIVPVEYQSKSRDNYFGVIGPLTTQEFNDKKKCLNIPDSLKFSITYNDLK